MPGKLLGRQKGIFLQARIKSINNILDNKSKQLEKCRSQLASLVIRTITEECQGFVNRVREFKYSKIRQREINKFNRLVEKHEGSLANSANIPYSWSGRSSSASTLGDPTNSQLREAGISGLSCSAQGYSSTPQPGDTSGSTQGNTTYSQPRETAVSSLSSSAQGDSSTPQGEIEQILLRMS